MQDTFSETALSSDIIDCVIVGPIFQAGGFSMSSNRLDNQFIQSAEERECILLKYMRFAIESSSLNEFAHSSEFKYLILHIKL